MQNNQAVCGHSSIFFYFKMAGDESGVTLGQPHLAKQDLNTLVSTYSLSVSVAKNVF